MLGKHYVDPTPEQLAALDALKSLLPYALVLHYSDYLKPFFPDNDTLWVGLGAALQQEASDAMQHPLLFISCYHIPVEKYYSATELQCL